MWSEESPYVYILWSWLGFNVIIAIWMTVKRHFGWGVGPRLQHGYMFNTGRFPAAMLDETITENHHLVALQKTGSSGFNYTYSWWKNTNTGYPPLILDVGAHYGGFAIHAAAQLEAEVHAFEPITELVNLAKENARNNGLEDRIHLVNCAVGERDGSMSMQTRPATAMGNSLAFPDKMDVPEFLITLVHNLSAVLDVPMPRLYTIYKNLLEGKHILWPLLSSLYIGLWGLLLFPATLVAILTESKIVQERTPVITLGQYIGNKIEKDRQVALLKIDVEGFGYEVLKGLDAHSLSRIQIITIECELNRKQQEMVTLLTDAGFQCTIEHECDGWDHISASRKAMPANK